MYSEATPVDAAPTRFTCRAGATNCLRHEDFFRNGSDFRWGICEDEKTESRLEAAHSNQYTQ